MLAAGAPVGPSDPPAGIPAEEVARTGFDITELLVAVAGSLRSIHAAAPGPAGVDRPDAGPAALVARARRRVAAGSVDRARFDPPYQRYDPAALLDLVERGRPADPAPEDLTVIHGGARLDRVWFDDGQVSGWSSLDDGGVGDPYRDLATMAVDLADRVTPEALGPFMDAYGLDRPDVVRLDWHVLLDQLLR